MREIRSIFSKMRIAGKLILKEPELKALFHKLLVLLVYDVPVILESAKTHLQHIAIACAINLTRLVAWFDSIPSESTRTSRFALLE